jgi:hypothetical protein
VKDEGWRASANVKPLVRRAMRVGREIRAAIGDAPAFPAGHYYSPIPSRADRKRAILSAGSCERWEVADAGLLDDHDSIVLSALADLPAFVSAMNRYHSPNDMYCLTDASIYCLMLRQLRPSLVIEIGAGFSTAVALDTRDAWHLPLRVECVEPYPARLRTLLRDEDSIVIAELPVQDVDLETYDRLRAGDFLFVDSTHVGKAGSDVLWILFHVLPRLAKGVYVHFHDVLWPFEYPAEWLDDGRAWNEAYLLRSFLMFNNEWKIAVFNDRMVGAHAGEVSALLPSVAGERPGGLWIQRL